MNDKYSETLREAMKKKGANDAMLNSKTLEMVETVIAENEGLIQETASDVANRIEARIFTAQRDISILEERGKQIKSRVDEVEGRVSEFVKGEEDKIIEDPKMKDALVLFHHVLAVTKEIFGDEKMTENVIIQAIEAGSYGIWRSIMGGKNDVPSEPRYKSKWKREHDDRL